MSEHETMTTVQMSVASAWPSDHSLWHEARERPAQVTRPQRHQGTLTHRCTDAWYHGSLYAIS